VRCRVEVQQQQQQQHLERWRGWCCIINTIIVILGSWAGLGATPGLYICGAARWRCPARRLQAEGS
jgi:hypothetical protein